ncbi:MAG TPA: hypothetical protein VNV42_04440 [Solirubrobacteraceae bacterium]|jgi:hypothetical protein|nr:hypothetical protein [Solirubrobacteraceae bacterium]
MSAQADTDVAQRAVILALLDRDPPATWTRARLKDTLGDIDPGVLAAALTQLGAVGVIRLDGEHVRASLATRRLEQLGMISI